MSKTPGYNTRLRIAFTANRSGQPIAYYWSGHGYPGMKGAGRWIRMSLAEARDHVAQGYADQVSYLTGSGTGNDPGSHRGSSRDSRRVLKRVDAMPGRAGMYRYGPASIWISGPSGGTWWATVRFRSQEKDLDARSLDAVLAKAMQWVDDAPELARRDSTRKLSKAAWIDTFEDTWIRNEAREPTVRNWENAAHLYQKGLSPHAAYKSIVSIQKRIWRESRAKAKRLYGSRRGVTRR